MAMRANRRHVPTRVILEQAPGRPDADLSEVEKLCLNAVLQYFASLKSTAQFQALCPTDHQTSEYGIWAWHLNGREITLTAMPRASMIEIVLDEAIEAGFVWNNILMEWNDVVLPSGFGRGQCKLIFGVQVRKADSEIRLQQCRIRFMTARRVFRQLLATATGSFQRAR
jgi:hypothetical protein